MNRPKLQRPPSAMSGVRQPSSFSRPASRASSNPSPNHDKQVPLKRAQTAVAKTTEQNTISNASSSLSETNIQVVVRCRDRNKREIDENSGVIVSPAKDGHSITVQTSALTELNNKTYTFDRVYGGGASQQQVFDDTVEPIVQEVLRYTSRIELLTDLFLDAWRIQLHNLCIRTDRHWKDVYDVR